MTSDLSALSSINSGYRHDSLLRWLNEANPEALERLWQSADRTRSQFVGGEIGRWGGIKVSNHCDDDCGFCGLRANHPAVNRYRLSADEVLAAARCARDAGCGLIVLQSGRDPGLAADWISDLIRRIRDETGQTVALSLGERSEAELAAWRRAGASAYFLRFMTANTALYRLLHAQACDDPRRRLPLLGTMKGLGYRTGTGVLVGFPGQSIASIADDLEFLRRLDVDIILIGPYIWPAELAPKRWYGPDREPGSARATLKVMALARLLCPSADIPSTTALASVGGIETHLTALRSGANILVSEFTPSRQAAEYRCYPDRLALDEPNWTGGAGDLRALVQQRKSSAAGSAPPAPDPPGDEAPVAPSVRVSLCMGSSCFSRGNNRTAATIRDFVADHHLENHVYVDGHLCECLCKDGPNIMVGEDMHHRADAAEIIGFLRQRLNVRG